MKKFITYKCSSCKRTIDKQVNNLQPFINKCDITLNCLGRLKPILVKSTKQLLPSSSNFEDWIPRNVNKPIISNEILPSEFLNLANSITNDLVLAIEESEEIETSIDLKFSIQHENTFPYTEYTYYIEPGVTSISGKDNSNNSQILKYTSDDEVLVYLNGKQITDFTKSIVNNIGYVINLNTTTVFKSTIKIIVYKQQEIITSNPIKFILNSELYSETNNSWSNITKINFNNKNYLIYICSDITDIALNSRLNLYPFENNLDLSKCFFLLSNPNFTSIDRNKNQVVPLNNLVEDNTYIKIEIKNNKYECLVTTSAIIDIFPEIFYLQFKDSSLEYTNERSEIVTEVIKKIENKFIIGPS